MAQFGRILCGIVLALTLSASLAGASPIPCAEEGYGDPALIAVDKARPLPDGYEPAVLVRLAAFDVPVFGRRDVRVDYVTAVAYERLVAAAGREGYEFVVLSGYRSYYDQRYTFFKWTVFEVDRAAEAGEALDERTARERANRYSALPGHSEHQLGTALDISTREIGLELSGALAWTPAGQWLAAHAHEFGFVTSYPEGKESLTGFKAEPWHIRYVGSSVAEDLHALDYRNPANIVTVNDYLAALPTAECSEPRSRRTRRAFE